jgi:hypothetical protein
MRITRVLATVAATLTVLGGGAIAAAPVASAAGATVSITTDCNHDVGLQANVGDTVVITMTADCLSNQGVVWNINALFVSATASGFFDAAAFQNAGSNDSSDSFSGDWYAYSDGSGTTTITTTLRGQDGAGNPIQVGSFLADIGFSANGPYGIYWLGARSSSGSKAIWIQGYGRASSDVACDEGWAPSWDQWPNDGQGGWTCTRLVYQDGSGPAA